MRLLYITNGVRGAGGLERVLSIKTKWFIDHLGYEIHIITLNEAHQDFFYEFHQNIQLHDLDVNFRKIGSLFHSYIRSVSEIVKKVQPDIVLVCDDGLKGLLAPIWLNRNIPLVYERHASLSLNGHGWKASLMKRASKLYQRFIVLTSDCVSDWGDGSNIRVIPNPLSQIPEQLSDLKILRAICVGSLSHNKGYDLLIKALSQVCQDFPEWQIDVYGRGEILAYQSLADAHGLQTRLKFCGATQHIEQEYQQASCLILPSRSEGFGMVLIEAMSYGVPCVAFDCPNGPRHIIQHEVTGLLAKNGDIHDLAKQIKTMFLDQEARELMGQRAQSTVVNNYHMDRLGLLWQQLFNELV